MGFPPSSLLIPWPIETSGADSPLLPLPACGSEGIGEQSRSNLNPMKYTHKSLCADLLALNAKLEKAGHAMRLVDGHRYGYSAIDLATEKQDKHHCIHRVLCRGTPRECLAESQAYVLQQI